MTIKRLFAICLIVACTTAAWFLLAGTLQFRSSQTNDRLGGEVIKNWGPELVQEPPTFFYEAPTSANPRRLIAPESTDIQVALRFEPKEKGLLKYRTYFVDFEAKYLVRNPTPIAQTIYAVFKFPAVEARYDQFSFKLGDSLTDKTPSGGELRESLRVPPGGEVPLTVSYRAAGTDSWIYALKNAKRVKNLHLTMTTNFPEIDTPAGAESANVEPRVRVGPGWKLEWKYADLIGANAIAMPMPALRNPGFVAGRMSFFAPVSLLFFFAVLVIVGMREGSSLHPMNYFFLAAGCFAFQLVFAYLVDLLPLTLSFLLAATISLVLVNGYLWRATNPRFAKISTVAQFTYMVLFSYSFFFEGLTGITITIGAVVTLALLMAFTARLNWNDVFSTRTPVPPIPPSQNSPI